MTRKKKRRIAILAGARTPFCKAGTDLATVSAADLGGSAVREALLRAGVRGDQVDHLIYGMVSVPVYAPNIAREVGLASGLPTSVPAYTISRACISANQAITSGADQIALGHADVVVAGGVETLSDVQILLSRPLRDALVEAGLRARTAVDRLKAFRQVRPKDLLPVPPAIAEPSTGQTMGESAEKMAKDFGIARQAQDRFASNSHARAVAAWADGHLSAHVAPVLVKGKDATLVERDNHPRADSTEEKLAKLRPVFDKKLGSVTAANSSPLTDGASAVVLAASDVAEANGWPIAGYLHSYHYTATDPFEYLLMGPVSAVAGVLDRAKLPLAQIGVIEMHEAFAAQVLSNIHGLGSAKYCEENLGRSKAVGEIDPETINRWGGSISLGHPFGATGGRLAMTVLDRMAAEDAEYGLVSACAAGAMGSAMIFSRS